VQLQHQVLRLCYWRLTLRSQGLYMSEAIIPGKKLTRDIRIHLYGLYPLISVGLGCYPKSVMESDGIKQNRDW